MMQTIADTILGDAEQLADLHDILQFKGRAYVASHKHMADSLSQCADIVGRASDVIIQDVVYELSKRQFPFGSRVRKQEKPQDNLSALLDEAIRTFPLKEVPIVDLMLTEMPQRLTEIKAKIAQYLDNKDTDLADLMAQQRQLMDYFISVAWCEN